MNDEQERELQIVLRTNVLAVLSTLADQYQPQSALVAFAEDKDLNLYFQTRLTSRKHKNLSEHRKVSLVIGWDINDLVTVQLEGVANEVPSTSVVKALFVKKESPSTSEYLNHADARFYKVNPSWVRYSDYSTKPPHIWELNINYMNLRYNPPNHQHFY